MEIKIFCNLNPKYKHGNQVLDTDGICICLTEAMGVGGGHIPLILTEDEREEHRREETHIIQPGQ